MIASLPMYDSPSTTEAYDRFWNAWGDRIRALGVDVPEQLARPNNSETVWTAPDLAISQTCGYPYVKSLRGQVRLIATPHYAVPGCDGPNYSSWIITHAANPAQSINDLRGTVAVINGSNSQSGYNIFRNVVAPLAEGQPFFADVKTSGGHRTSMEMIAAGEGDCATVDAVSWAIAGREKPELHELLKPLASTPSAPGLPFITSAERGEEQLSTFRNALFEVLSDPHLEETLSELMISGASVLSDAEYDVCIDMEADAMSAGYPKLA